MTGVNYIKNCGYATIYITRQHEKFNSFVYEEDDPIYLFGTKIYMKKESFYIKSYRMKITNDED